MDDLIIAFSSPDSKKISDIFLFEKKKKEEPFLAFGGDIQRRWAPMPKETEKA